MHCSVLRSSWELEFKYPAVSQWVWNFRDIRCCIINMRVSAGRQWGLNPLDSTFTSPESGFVVHADVFVRTPHLNVPVKSLHFRSTQWSGPTTYWKLSRRGKTIRGPCDLWNHVYSLLDSDVLTKHSRYRFLQVSSHPGIWVHYSVLVHTPA